MSESEGDHYNQSLSPGEAKALNSTTNNNAPPHASGSRINSKQNESQQQEEKDTLLSEHQLVGEGTSNATSSPENTFTKNEGLRQRKTSPTDVDADADTAVPGNEEGISTARCEKGKEPSTHSSTTVENTIEEEEEKGSEFSCNIWQVQICFI